MKTTVASLKRGISKAGRLRKEKHFDQALAQVNRLMEESPNNPYLLVMRGDLIQLQDDESEEPALEDAKADYLSALALDPDSASALIELGYFSHVVEDDAKAAVKHFEKAVHLCADLFAQALVGHAEALSEIGQKSKALNSVMEACTIMYHHREDMSDHVLERIKELLESSLAAGPDGKNGTHDS